MSNPVPSQIALSTITNGTLADGSVVQANDAAIQAAVNAIIVALSNGTNGQFLKATDSSDVVWEAAASLVAASAQPFTSSISGKQLGVGVNSTGLSVASGAITIVDSMNVISSTDGSAVTDILGRDGVATILFLRNNSGSNIQFATGGSTGTKIALPFLLEFGQSALLLWDGTQPGGAWLPFATWPIVSFVSNKNTITYGTTVTPDCSLGEFHVCTITNTTAFTIGNPLNAPGGSQAQRLTIMLRNTSGSTSGSISFGTAWDSNSFATFAVAAGDIYTVSAIWNGDASKWVAIAGV